MIASYKKLKNITIDNSIPKTYHPSPTEDDYSRGYVKRYFLQERGTHLAPVFEISSDTVTEYATSQYYQFVSLMWRISGELEDTYTSTGNLIPSVLTSNRMQIKEVSLRMPAMRVFLRNLKQFHRS